MNMNVKIRVEIEADCPLMMGDIERAVKGADLSEFTIMPEDRKIVLDYQMEHIGYKED